MTSENATNHSIGKPSGRVDNFNGDELEDFINHVTGRVDRGVTAQAAEVLVGDARYVLGKLW